VFSPFPEPVDTVMVNGKFVVEKGQLVGVDVEQLVERANAISTSLLGAAGKKTGKDYLKRPSSERSGRAALRARPRPDTL